MVKNILRLESTAILILLLGFYFYFNLSWISFAIFILIPDIFMLGYLKDKKIGAIIYNLGHSYSSPIILFGFSIIFDYGLSSIVSIIWAIHIAADRALGFGLKYPTGFKDTHIQKV